MNYAVKCGHPKIIRSIEQKSVLINPEFVENLHMAVKNEDVNCVKELLEDQDLGVQEKKIARVIHFCESSSDERKKTYFRIFIIKRKRARVFSKKCQAPEKFNSSYWNTIATLINKDKGLR